MGLKGWWDSLQGPRKRLLLSGSPVKGLRVAIVDGDKLIPLERESASVGERTGNIYKGVVTRVQADGASIHYGEERFGFLPLREIFRSQTLHKGGALIVQCSGEEHEHQGATLTTFIRLTGRCLVLMPNGRRERNAPGDAIAGLEVPEGMSLARRETAAGCTPEALEWDLSYLLQLWEAIESASRDASGRPFLIYLESSPIIRAFREHFQPDVDEVLVDSTETYEQARAFMQVVMPENFRKVKLYRDETPLFSRFLA